MKKNLILSLLAIMTITVASAKKGEVVTTKFQTDIDGCPKCSAKIMNKIPYEKGVKDVKIELKSKVISVSYDSSKNNDSLMVKSFEKLGVKAQVAK